MNYRPVTERMRRNYAGGRERGKRGRRVVGER